MKKHLPSTHRRALSLTALFTFILIILTSAAFSQSPVISAGSAHSMALYPGGKVYTWGNNSQGTLGDGTTNGKSTPIQVGGLTGITSITGGKGSFSLFLKSDNTVWACGANNYGQLGDNTIADKVTPIQISGLSGVTAVAAGFSFSLFLKSDGTVWACGYNYNGQLGDNSTIEKHVPVQVSGLSNIIAIAAGNTHSIFLKDDGTVWTCGANSNGQLGDNSTIEKHAPMQVSGLTNIIAIAAGNAHSLFLRNDNTVWACGANSYGQFGNGSTTPSNIPLQITALSGTIKIAAGMNHSVFLKNDNTVWTSGSNSYGQLGNGTGTPSSVPVQVSGLVSPTAIAAGDDHSLFLQSDGLVKATGKNTYGQLGNGGGTNQNAPVTVAFLKVSASSVNITCNGANNGSASSTAVGGTGPYTYLWSPGGGTISNINNLAAGTYTITVGDANGASEATVVTINQPPPLIANAGPNQSICNGGNTTIGGSPTATGGSVPYTFYWNPGSMTVSNPSVNPIATTTYTVNVTDYNGCTTMSTMLVTVNPLPNVTATSVTICNGSSAPVTATGANTYTWTPAIGLNATTGANVIASPLATTTYTITGTSAVGCIKTTSVIVTVNPLPTPSISGASIICNGTGTTLTAFGGNSYTWNTGTTTASISVSPSSNITYTVTATDGLGCSNTATKGVTVNPLPIVTITGSTIICDGASTTLTASGGGTYNWNTGASSAAITVSPGFNTTYTVTVTSGSGCVASQSQDVTVNSPPAASITGTTLICEGTSTTLTATGGNTYNWNTSENTAAITVSPSVTTSFTVTVTNAAGCTANAVQTVTVYAAPTLTTSTTNATCGSSNGSATVTASGGNPGYTYNWSPSGGVAATAPGLLAGNYTVTVTDANGCTKMASVSVNNSGAPTVGISSVTNVNCTGSATGAASVTATGGTPPYTYSWNNAGGSVTSSVSGLTAGAYICTVTDANGCVQGQSVNITQPVSALNPSISSQANVGCAGSATGSATVNVTGGTPGYTYNWSNGLTTTAAIGLLAGTYSVTITDSNGCTALQTVSITQPTTLIADAGTSSTICQGSSAGLGGSPTASGGAGTHTYLWNPGSMTLSNPTVSPTVTTTYTVTVTDGNGCTANASTTVTVNAGPTVSISGTSTICLGDSTIITASGATSYFWNTSANTAAITVYPAVNTTYTVTGTSAGCSNSSTIAITVNPFPTVSISGATTICDGSATTLTASGATTYLWNTGANTANITVSPATTTNYTVTGTNMGCSNSTTIVVSVSPVPTISISGATTVCDGNATTLTASGASTYLWNTGANTANITVSPATTTNYTVTGTSAACSNSATIMVTVSVAPTISITGATTICNGNATTLTASGAGTYLWNTSANTAAITVSPFANTTYIVTGTSAGCSNSASVVVTVNPNPMANAGADKTICANTIDTLKGSAIGGTAPYMYSWDSGSSIYPVQNAVVIPSTTTAYTLTVTDVNGCTSIDNVNLNVTPSTDILGHISYSGGNVTGAKVLLFKYLGYNTHFDTIQNVTSDPSGNYLFSNVDYGNYLVEVFADTSMYKNSIPTYYGNVFLWDSATVIIHNCAVNNTANITLIEIPVLTGNGFISGIIKEGEGFARSTGDPIPDIDVKMGKNPGGGIAGVATTDANGYYKFTNVDLGSFTLFADIPGLGRDSSYTVIITPSNLIHDSLNYQVDSAKIRIVTPVVTTGINKNNTLVMVIENNFRVYPNPAIGNATIEYSINTDTDVSLGIYNMLGVKVHEIVTANQSAGNYKYTVNAKKNNLSSGIYFVTLIKDGKTSIQRLVVTD